MIQIPAAYRYLLDRPVFVSLATHQPDGTIQVTPVWADSIDSYIRINTAVGRQKYKNLVERPQVTLMAFDPENPYRYMEIRGRVARMSEDDADDVLDKFARDYLGVDSYPARTPDETRITILIEPLRVLTADFSQGTEALTTPDANSGPVHE